MEMRAVLFHVKQKDGGPGSNRNCDPLLAKQTLSQLSYKPGKEMVGVAGLEPATP